MNPTHLRARNYRTFRNLDRDLPTGCVGVIGENGAGKSSIVQAIDVALFGPETRSLEPYLSRDALPGDTLLIELELEQRGELYRITRTFTSGGRGKSTLEFARFELAWETLTQGNAADTQSLIERTFGMTRAIFRDSSMLATDGTSFCEAAPRDRKDRLSAALGLAMWERAKTLVTADKRDRVTRIEALNGRIALFDERLADAAQVEQRVTELAGDVERADAELLTLTERAAKAKAEYDRLVERDRAAATASAALQLARSELDSLEREHARAQEAAAAAGLLSERLPGMRARADRLRALEAERDELNEQRAVIERAREQRVDLTQQIERAASSRQRALEAVNRVSERLDSAQIRISDLHNASAAHCPTCEQELPDAAREKAIATSEREADNLLAEQQRAAGEAHDLGRVEEGLRARLDELPEPNGGAELDARYEAFRTEGRELGAAREDLAAALERLAGYQATASIRESFEGEREAAQALVRTRQAELGDLEVDPSEAAQARDFSEHYALERDHRREETETQRLALAQARARLEAIEEARAGRAAAITELATLNRDLDELTLLERAFGRDGVPTWILENIAIPAIEMEADELLKLFGIDYRVELRTQRELKSGETGESLDIVISTPTGHCDYRFFSTGEKLRINAALTLAFSRLADGRGQRSDLFVIDDFGPLDRRGVEALVDVLHGVASRVRCVLVISQDSALSDAFDQVLTVVKDESGSRVTGRV